MGHCTEKGGKEDIILIKFSLSYHYLKDNYHHSRHLNKL